MEEKLTNDEKKIIADFLTTPHWRVIQKLLRGYQRNTEKVSMGVEHIEDLARLQGAYRLATQIEVDLHRIAKDANNKKG